MPTLERNQEIIRVCICVRSHMTCSSIWVPFLRPPDVGNKRILQGVSNRNNGSKITGKDLKLLRPGHISSLNLDLFFYHVHDCSHKNHTLFLLPKIMRITFLFLSHLSKKGCNLLVFFRITKLGRSWVSLEFHWVLFSHWNWAYISRQREVLFNSLLRNCFLYLLTSI